jgi:hypothetical protein
VTRQSPVLGFNNIPETVYVCLWPHVD